MCGRQGVPRERQQLTLQPVAHATDDPDGRSEPLDDDRTVESCVLPNTTSPFPPVLRDINTSSCCGALMFLQVLMLACLHRNVVCFVVSHIDKQAFGINTATV